MGGIIKIYCGTYTISNHLRNIDGDHSEFKMELVVYGGSVILRLIRVKVLTRC